MYSTAGCGIHVKKYMYLKTEQWKLFNLSSKEKYTLKNEQGFSGIWDYNKDLTFMTSKSQKDREAR